MADTDKQRQLAFELLMQDSKFDYNEKLKTLFPPVEWEEVLDTIVVRKDLIGCSF